MGERQLATSKLKDADFREETTSIAWE